MEFLPEAPRRSAEGVVPMINVAFLLLIFFLMMAKLVPADPFDVTLPKTANGTPADVGEVLVVTAGGEIGFRELRGEAVYKAIAVRHGDDALAVRADRSAPGAKLANILAKLALAGTSRVQLVTVPQ